MKKPSYIVKRVCILGAESTGTTTLAKELANRFKTAWVVEFGRYYSICKKASKFSRWENKEFEYIAKIQNSMEDQLALYANKVLFCDTNALVTYAWQEYFLGKGTREVEAQFKNRKYDLHVITDIDIPYVQDEVRRGKRRKQFHERLIELLNYYKQDYIVASGSLDERIKLVSDNLS